MGRNFIWRPRRIYPMFHAFQYFSLLFFFIKNTDVVSYAGDTTPYETGGTFAYVIHNLEVLGNTLLKWFNDNNMKANPGKYHLPLSGSDSSKIIIGNKIISSSKCKKPL